MKNALFGVRNGALVKKLLYPYTVMEHLISYSPVTVHAGLILGLANLSSLKSEFA